MKPATIALAVTLQWLIPSTVGTTANAGEASGSKAAPSSPVPKVHQAIDVEVPIPPEPARTATGTQLVYELHVTNFAPTPIELTHLEIRAQEDGRILRDLRASELANLIGHPGVPADAGKRTIAPGTRAVIYLELTVDTFRLPRALSHRMGLRIDQGAVREDFEVESGPVSVRMPPPLQLGPPLRGGPWVAIYDPAANRGHRRVIDAVNGRARIPGRFAIDWIKVNEHGQYTHDDATRIINWYGYGAEVLAVADAQVAAVRDGIGESAVVTTVRGDLENASGNYVALDLGQGRYAFYEHLKTGSVAVKAGDRVKRGQVLGRLGYTGDSTGPHLHFHVSDGVRPVEAEGMPYVLERFDMLGAYASLEAFGKGQPWSVHARGASSRRSMEFPLPGAVVNFGP